jgi:hypothetical protein
MSLLGDGLSICVNHADAGVMRAFCAGTSIRAPVVLPSWGGGTWERSYKRHLRPLVGKKCQKKSLYSNYHIKFLNACMEY